MICPKVFLSFWGPFHFIADQMMPFKFSFYNGSESGVLAKWLAPLALEPKNTGSNPTWPKIKAECSAVAKRFGQTQLQIPYHILPEICSKTKDYQDLCWLPQTSAASLCKLSRCGKINPKMHHQYLLGSL